MLDWLKGRRRFAFPGPEINPEPVKPPLRAMSGKYVLLYKYLENRYANTVVLTFTEIEDLLGFALPDQARLHPEWWTDAASAAGRTYSDSWVLARRTATPNLRAQTVAFERAA
jgi:hypothetical protein